MGLQLTDKELARLQALWNEKNATVVKSDQIQKLSTRQKFQRALDEAKKIEQAQQK
jgi:hypothetical protein